MQTDTSARGTSAVSERASGRAPAEVNEYIRTDTRPRVCVCVFFTWPSKGFTVGTYVDTCLSPAAHPAQTPAGIIRRFGEAVR